MATPFERLAQVFDNASANYLAEEQRKSRLADQRGYDAQQLADQRQYAEGRLAEGRTYDEGLTNKNRAYEQEAALFKLGYLSKPVGTNTPEEIAAGAALAAQRSLAIRDDEDSTRRDTAAQRGHDAKKREREEQGWALNPQKSDERKAMEAEVDGGMINFGKPAADMTEAELRDARAKTHADSILRGDSGTRYATQIEQEVLNVQAQTGTAPTAAELSAARAANQPRSMSREDRAAAEQAAQVMAGNAAMQRAAFANVRLRELSNIREALIRTKQFPNEIPAALGDSAPKDPPPNPATTTAPAAALGLGAELDRKAAAEALDRDWPEIQKDYELAALGDDAKRQRISIPVWDTTMTPGSFMGPAASTITSHAPTTAEQRSRLDDLDSEQAAAVKRLVKRRAQFEGYTPADEERARQVAAILGLTKTSDAVKEKAFISTAAALGQQALARQ